MGCQGNSLFYLDPHHSRPAISLRHPPPQFMADAQPRAPSSEEGERDSASDDWWCQAYSDAQLSTFHCDRVRRMPIKGLDPSMLLGFLCMDEASLDDLTSKVRSLNKPIFSIQDSPPSWMGIDMGIPKEGEEESAQDLEDDLAIESFSESNGSGSEDDEEESEDWIQGGGFSRIKSNKPDEEEDLGTSKSETLSGSAELEPPISTNSKNLKKQLSTSSDSNSIRFPLSNDSPNLPSATNQLQSSSRHPSGTSESTFKDVSRRVPPLTTSGSGTSATYLGDETFSSVGSSDGEASAWEQVSPTQAVGPSPSRGAEGLSISKSEEAEGSDQDDF